MNLYLNNIISRLMQFSRSLDEKEIFIEVPWVIIDENLNQQKYIFKRNGDLIMSFNGTVNIGKWEYLSAAKSLLIDRIQDKILMNQNFIDQAVMILKKDGLKDEKLIMANEILIPDLNVESYLKNLFYQKNKIVIKQLKNGKCLELYRWDGWMTGFEVCIPATIEGEKVSDGFFESAELNLKFLIKDSCLIKVVEDILYKTDRGEIIIQQGLNYTFFSGDYVLQGNKPAPDGKYRLGFMNHIRVKNGRII